MGLKQTILGTSYDIKVERIKPSGPDVTDKAAIKTDDITEEQKLVFKSDGLELPKPGDDKIKTRKQNKWYHNLMGGDNYVKAVKFIDYGDGTGDFVDIDFDKGLAKESGNSRMFETHRNLMSKKYAELFSEDDNTQVWLAAYLTVLALVTIGAMYFVTTGIEKTVADAVGQGIQAGLSASENAQGAAGGVPGGGG